MSGTVSIGATSPGGFASGADALGGNAAHEQAFAAAVQASSPAQQVDAQPAVSTQGMMTDVTQRLDSVADGLRIDPVAKGDAAQLQALAPGDPASAAPEHARAPKSIDQVTQEALDSYRSSIVLSVEAQVATNGSSTSTKTFNSLMRGS